MISIRSAGQGIGINTTTAETITYSISYTQDDTFKIRSLTKTGAITSATGTTLLGANNSYTSNVWWYTTVRYMAFKNEGSASNTLTLVTTTDFISSRAVSPPFTLNAGEILIYSDGLYTIYTASGFIKTSYGEGVRKILGQANPAATETVLYTVPAATKTDCHSLFVCNLDTVAVTFSVGISVGGGSLGNADYILKGWTLDVAATYQLDAGGKAFASLSATDEIRVIPSTANVAFNLSGEEFS